MKRTAVVPPSRRRTATKTSLFLHGFSHQKRCLQVGAHVPSPSGCGRVRRSIRWPAAVPLDVPHDPEGRGLKHSPTAVDAVQNHVVIVVAVVAALVVGVSAVVAAAALAFDCCKGDGGDVRRRALPPRVQRAGFDMEVRENDQI